MYCTVAEGVSLALFITTLFGILVTADANPARGSGEVCEGEMVSHLASVGCDVICRRVEMAVPASVKPANIAHSKTTKWSKGK